MHSLQEVHTTGASGRGHPGEGESSHWPRADLGVQYGAKHVIGAPGHAPAQA